MFTGKWINITKALIKSIIPGTGYPSATGGTDRSHYCYSTWLRHLILLNRLKKHIPTVVAELGPGDSLGTGLAALLSGCEKYIALDAFVYGNVNENLKIFDELVSLFQSRTAIPGEAAYPKLTPQLDNYDFPVDILTEEVLSRSLDVKRLAAIRNELASPSASNNFINYFVPWQSGDITNESIDFIFSQSVLEYIDPELIYPAMHKWLVPGGMMAHVIDFSSIGMTKAWNGHWAYSPFEWNLFCIGKKMKINRAPLSDHIQYLEKNDLSLLDIKTYKKENGLPPNLLAKAFSRLPPDILETHAAYMLAGKIK